MLVESTRSINLARFSPEIRSEGPLYLPEAIRERTSSSSEGQKEGAVFGMLIPATGCGKTPSSLMIHDFNALSMGTTSSLQLLAGQRFVDVTLACEGHQVQCHRLVLAACSTYFENLLGENPCQHPIIILPRDIKLWAIQALVDFMYKGEVNVSQAGLPDLMKCAEILKIRGLCGSDAALNLNQIHSPPQRASTGGGQASSVSSSGHLSAGSSDLVMPPEADHHRMTSTKDAPVPNSKNTAANSQIHGKHLLAARTGSFV